MLQWWAAENVTVCEVHVAKMIHTQMFERAWTANLMTFPFFVFTLAIPFAPGYLLRALPDKLIQRIAQQFDIPQPTRWLQVGEQPFPGLFNSSHIQVYRLLRSSVEWACKYINGKGNCYGF